MCELRLNNNVARSRRATLAVATAATVVAALAISYLEHLDTTGAGTCFGFFSVITAAGATCSLSVLLAALPLGLFICFDAPPSSSAPKSVCALAVLLDLITFASAAMGSIHQLESLYQDRSHLVLSLLFFITLGVYFFYLVRLLFRLMSAASPRLFSGESLADGSTEETELERRPVNSKKLFLCSFVVLLIAWSPYVISMAPGSDCPDISWQIAQFLTGDYSSHHPLWSTFVYGAVFSIGNSIAGSGAGLLCAMLLQTVALALALSLEVVELGRLGFKRPVLFVALAFFAIVPVFGSYCQWVVKDSLFGACFALYATVFVRCCVRAARGGVSRRDLLLLLAASVAAGLLRNNGFYVVALAALAFALVFRKTLALKGVVLVLAVIPLIMGLNQAALVATGAQKGDMREALSIPFQQTARYVLYHGDDVTADERRAIDAVLDYSDLADRYAWSISDAVKGKANTADRQTLLAYFKVWAQQGLRHPVCYLEATLDQTFGYWSVFDPAVYRQEYAGYGTTWVSQNVGGEADSFFSVLAGEVTTVVGAIKNLPFLRFFSISGFYTLAGLVLSAFALYRGKPMALLLLLPSALLLLTCIAGPLNGSIRYSFGFIAAFPIITGACLRAFVDNRATTKPSHHPSVHV